MRRNSRALLGASRTLLAAIPLVVFPFELTARQDTVRVAPACNSVLAEPVSDLGGTAEELLRMAELGGGASMPLRTLRRPSDDAVYARCGEPLPAILSLGPLRVVAAPVELASWLNSGAPDDRNNGAAWAGRGVSGALRGGVRLSLGPVSAGFLPAFVASQNADFDRLPGDTVRGLSAFAHPHYRTIDLPQRPGAGTVVEMHPGQSYARIDLFGLAAGVSTENLWLGPAMRNPLLMSNTAPGFRHVFAGTGQPIGIGIGELDLRVVIGWTEESEYFDADATNDESRISLWIAGFRPRFVEGLEIGVARSYTMRPDSASAFDQLASTLGLMSDRNLFGNEIAAIYGRLVLPESGAEIYGEWGRDDRWANVEDDLLPEPDHAQAFMIGFQKITELSPARALRVTGEISHLQESAQIGRNAATLYTHHQIRQGHTHRGQILGGFIGPGADAQYLEVDLLMPLGLGGLFAERVRRNDGAARALRARDAEPYVHDVELSLGARALLVRGAFTASGSLLYFHRPHRDFTFDDNGFRMAIELDWRPGGGR